MKRPAILGAAAIVASLAVPSIAQAACAKYDPSCATYPRPKNDAPAVNRTSVRTDVYRSAPRAARVERRVVPRERYGYYDRGPGPAGVVGGAVGAAVGTAGAIATAPFRAARAADAYAYDRDGGYRVPQQSYAERNGFTCTPGTLIKGFDGRMHVCQ
jgi:hypothetical protein